MPLYGYVDQISRSAVHGWAVNTEHPNGEVWISVHCNGAHRGSCLTHHHRPGITLPNGQAAPENCAFRFTFDPPLSAFDEQQIEVSEIWSGAPLPNGRRVLPSPSRPHRQQRWTPVILTSTGRTATTLLMNEFARHPDMVVADRYPYEIKQIAYYSAAFRALVADADRERSTNPDTMLAPQMRQIVGANPYHDPGLFNIAAPASLLQNFYETIIPDAYAATFLDLIARFYAVLADSLGKSAATLFCEKGDIDDAARSGARLFFGAVKEIVVIRDPRDLLCSAMAFWKLPGEEALSMLRLGIAQLARIIRQAGPDTMVVRYEDLLLDPVGCRREIANFIGLDQPLQMAGEARALFDSHGTSKAPAASVGRWETELSNELIAACDHTFGYFMRDFDYYPSDGTRWPARGAGEAARGSDQLIAATGRLAVVDLVEKLSGEGVDDQAPRQLLALSFGCGDNGVGFLRQGWSMPEDGFVWSAAGETELCVPAIRQYGEYRLYIVGDPFTFGTALPAQRVTVALNGKAVGTASMRDSTVLGIAVPPAVTGASTTVTLTLHLPDARRPSELTEHNDTRRLAFALRQIILCQVVAAPVREKSVPDAALARNSGNIAAPAASLLES